MSNRRRTARLIAACFCCALPMLVVGCAKQGATDNPSPETQFRAVATTGPVGDAVRWIVGDRIEVSVMMGPGIDPHLYRPLPSDLKKLESADLIFYNGLHLEGRLSDVLETMSEKKFVVSLTAGLVASEDPRLLTPEDYAGLHDPHVWHDVALWSDCIQHACDALCEFDADGAELYRENTAEFRKHLASLHEEVTGSLSAVPEEARVMVTAHDAFAYYGAAYGIETVGLKGISTEDEVDLGQMDAVAEMLVERNAPCVFIESAVLPQIVEALVESCASRGHTVAIGGELYADALGPSGTLAEKYMGMIRANTATIAAGLSSGVTEKASP